MAYCIDTSAFVEAGARRYPIDVFPGLWGELDRVAAEGQFLAPEEVFYELRAKADPVHEWARGHREIFVPLDGEQMVSTFQVLSDFPRLVGKLKGTYDADAFVVALARVRDLTVVTEEDLGTPDRPRIPIACQYFGVRWIDTLAWIREMGLTF